MFYCSDTSHNIQGYYENSADNVLPTGHVTSFNEHRESSFKEGGANLSENRASHDTLHTRLDVDKHDGNYAADSNKVCFLCSVSSVALCGHKLTIIESVLSNNISSAVILQTKQPQQQQQR